MRFVTDSAALSDRLVLPIDGLSEETQAIIEGYAKGYQCNRDIITAAVFMAASTAIGKRACTDDGRYKNYFPFFICVVAPSGSNKSTPMREVLRPLSERNAANYEAFREEMKQYEMEVKAGNENAEKPRFRQLIISDSTPESRTKALMENPNVLLVSDEIATMLYNLNRYNRCGEVPQLLSIWSMDDVIINRKSEMPQLIREPFLSIIGGTQPDVLADTFGSDYFMSSGFNQRWLFVYPDDEPPAMYSESYVSTEISEAWRGFINVLLDDTFVAGGTVTLFIRGEAKQCYIDYYDQLQRKKADADGYMSAVYSKLQIMVQRWAGVAHFLGEHSTRTYISGEEMEYAVRCMEYFERCAEKVYMKLLEGRKSPEAKPMGMEEMIANVYHMANPVSQSAVADALGCSKQFISKCLKKFPKLTGCRLTDAELTENEIDTDKYASTT